MNLFTASNGIPSWRASETATVYCPLGLRCLDGATGLPILDPLHIEVVPAAFPNRPVRAVRGPSGFYSFQKLPGLLGWESREDPETAAAQAAPRYPFILMIRDPWEKFLPIAMRVVLPWIGGSPLLSSLSEFPGQDFAASPPEGRAWPAFFLFPSPARRVGPGSFAVRGTLRSVSGNGIEPAAFALVQVTLSGITESTRRCYGLSDARGEFAVYGTFASGETGELPPGPIGSWSRMARVEVRHDPAVNRSLVAGMPEAGLVAGQPPALIATGGPTGPFEPGIGVTLAHGKDVVLRTEGLSELRIRPTA